MSKQIIINIPEYSEEYKANEKTLGSITSKQGGIYFFYGSDSELLYVGKAKFLRPRIQQHISGHSNTKDIKHNFKTFRVMYEDDSVQRDMLETFLINTLRPLLNTQKVYTYTTRTGEDCYYTSAYLSRRDKFDDELSEVYSMIEV